MVGNFRHRLARSICYTHENFASYSTIVFVVWGKLVAAKRSPSFLTPLDFGNKSANVDIQKALKITENTHIAPLPSSAGTAASTSRPRW